MTALAIVGAMFEQSFVRNAFIAGTPVAVAAGLVGYFVVLRNQVFVSDVLTHVAFTGALAAYAFAIEPLAGLLAATLAFGALAWSLGDRAENQDVVTGTLFAWVLGIGVLFLSIYANGSHSSAGNAGVSVLFGSIYGIDRAHTLAAVAAGAGVVLATLLVARPLLFASIDPDVAASRGLPARGLGLVFVVLLAVTVAEAVQVVGALLLLGLIVTPAAAAVRLTTRLFGAMALSGLIAASALWVGLVVNYYAPKAPVSFAVIAAAFAGFVASVLWGSLRVRARQA